MYYWAKQLAAWGCGEPGFIKQLQRQSPEKLQERDECFGWTFLHAVWGMRSKAGYKVSAQICVDVIHLLEEKGLLETFAYGDDDGDTTLHTAGINHYNSPSAKAVMLESTKSLFFLNYSEDWRSEEGSHSAE